MNDSSFCGIFKIQGLFVCLFLDSPTACGILVLWLGIKPMPPAVEVQNPNHWTVRVFLEIKKKISLKYLDSALIRTRIETIGPKFQRCWWGDLPGGPTVKNPPSNAGEVCSSTDAEPRFHMPQGEVSLHPILRPNATK